MPTLPHGNGIPDTGQGRGLTDKQQRFVEEYLVDLNATQAAIRAGYSENTARQIGYENLAKPDIQAAIAEKRSEQAKRTAISADMVLEGLLKETKGENPGSTKVQAWSWLGKHLAMFTEKHKIEDDVTIRFEVDDGTGNARTDPETS
jgi:hypothetical protein